MCDIKKILENKIEGINVDEIKKTIKFLDNSTYVNLCNNYESVEEDVYDCERCVIGKQIPREINCEEVFTLIKYGDILTDEVIKNICDEGGEYCKKNCEFCSLNKVYRNHDDCYVMINAINTFLYDNKDKNEDLENQYLKAKIDVINKKIDLILEMLIKK